MVREQMLVQDRMALNQIIRMTWQEEEIGPIRYNLYLHVSVMLLVWVMFGDSLISYSVMEEVWVQTYFFLFKIVKQKFKINFTYIYWINYEIHNNHRRKKNVLQWLSKWIQSRFHCITMKCCHYLFDSNGRIMRLGNVHQFIFILIHFIVTYSSCPPQWKWWCSIFLFLLTILISFWQEINSIFQCVGLCYVDQWVKNNINVLWTETISQSTKKKLVKQSL